MKKYDNYQILKESSLSRVWKHNIEHDCGALTAFRNAENCGDGRSYSKQDNLKRNKSLLAKLQAKGYGVTRLIGKYPEGGKESKEISFFVVDLQDSGNLYKDLISLGEYFDQDSILYIPQGSIEGKEKAFLIGTNHCPDNWLGYHKKEYFQKGKLGYNSPIYTSYVNGRPFLFESVSREIKAPQNGYGFWQLGIVAKKDWRDIEL